MKILQVIPYFCFGGAETMCENLTYALLRAGYQVTVVSLYNKKTPISQRMEAAGVSIRYLDKKLGMDVSMVPKLLRIMKEEKPDAVHTHLDVLKYTAAAAKLAGIKKCVHTVHNVAEKEAEGLTRKISHMYFRLGLAKPVALSPEVQQTIVRTYGLEPSRVPVIYNGIDLSRCIPRGTWGGREVMTLLHIGRFNEQKNHAGLLRAYQKIREHYPNTRLDLLGDGELFADMKTYARELGIEDSVRFLGSQTNVYPYLHNADLFLLPSDYEGMPMTIIEAMGTGLPIVATAVGGVPDMLENGESGLLVPRDEDAVSKAVCRLLSDAGLRRALGEKAMESSRRFSAEHMAEEYCRLYC